MPSPWTNFPYKQLLGTLDLLIGRWQNTCGKFSESPATYLVNAGTEQMILSCSSCSTLCRTSLFNNDVTTMYPDIMICPKHLTITLLRTPDEIRFQLALHWIDNVMRVWLKRQFWYVVCVVGRGKLYNNTFHIDVDLNQFVNATTPYTVSQG